MIIDGHTDVLWALTRERRKFSEKSETGHVDLPRLRKGNVLASFFAVFPAMSDFEIYKGVDQWFSLIEDQDNNLLQVKSAEDINKCKMKNKIGAVLHFEGSGGIDSEFLTLKNYYRMGLRSIGLSWSNVNRFATGVTFNMLSGESFEQDRGLTEIGKELVKELNNLGIIVDVSHLNEKSFWDVIDQTSKPIIASHSNAYSICNHPRNLKDEQIRAIAETNGTIGLNFCVSFLSSDKKKDQILLEDLKKHIDHIVELVGINHIGFGSDFDGATVPDVLKDVSYYPVLVDYLGKNGYNQEDIQKIESQNLLRVMKEVWK